MVMADTLRDLKLLIAKQEKERLKRLKLECELSACYRWKGK